MSRASVGTLSALVTANPQGMIAGLGVASNAVHRFRMQVNTTGQALANRLSPAGLGLRAGLWTAAVGASLLAVNRLRREFVQTASEMSAIAKQGDRLGLGANELRQLQFAAKLANVDVELFQRSLERMARSGADAAVGLTEPLRAFRLLKIDVQDFIRLPVDRQLELIADRMKEVQNIAQRTQITQAIFGRGGQALIPLLQGGSVGIAGARLQAIGLGATASNAAFRQAEQLVDAMDRLAFATTSLKITLASALVDSGLVDIINALAKRIGNFRFELPGWLPGIIRFNLRGGPAGALLRLWLSGEGPDISTPRQFGGGGVVSNDDEQTDILREIADEIGRMRDDLNKTAVPIANIQREFSLIGGRLRGGIA